MKSDRLCSQRNRRRCVSLFTGIVVLFVFGSVAATFAATTQTGSPLFRYGAFATSNTCGAITFSANKTDSFDSSLGSYAATKQNSGGNIGANGNISLSGAATVNGTASSPHAGTAACNNQSITGLTTIEGALVTGGMVILAGPVVYATPPAPIPLPPAFARAVSIRSMPTVTWGRWRRMRRCVSTICATTKGSTWW